MKHASPKSLAPTRRSFLKNAALATGGLLILPTGFLRGQTAPSNRINIAAIGVGGMGFGDLTGVATAGGTIGAVCDVDAIRLARAQRAFPDAQAFADYRELFEKRGKDIDAVVVSTPDHLHFTIACTAVELGKHVYVQKPMCHTVDQVRRLSSLAAEKKVATQMGNQGQSSSHIRKAREWYEAGLIGAVSQVEAWTNRPHWPQGMSAYRPVEKAPPHLDWNLWLGPVSERPYSPKIAPFDWRGYYEFGCGALGDMGIHLINDAFYVLSLTAPTKIEVEIPRPSAVAFPAKSTLTYHFPAHGDRGPVKLVWREGGEKPPVPDGTDALPDNGSLILGSAAALSLSGWSDTFTPLVTAEKRAALLAASPPTKYPRVKGSHYRNWLDAIRKGTQASSHFGYAGPFAETILLGVIAQRLGRTLHWDAAAGRFTNDAEANQLLTAPPPRAGFLA
ncbi:MAG: Gfo/Idh/MocA family oxidoreductase [Puniceicoccales bacterium]|jgi:predicted dehydrogenase|nr:Gfo/Idh/MocA family oxidoreductase [Puniceicoccales bacterium]